MNRGIMLVLAGMLVCAAPGASGQQQPQSSPRSSGGVGVEAGIGVQLDALLQGMQPEVASAARAIPDPGRRLLALRSYLRAGEGLASRWSWTAAQAAEFLRSADGEAQQRAILAVQCAFAAANPGHVLYVNPGFRSLEIQLQRWNTNASVGDAASRLLQMLHKDAGRAMQDSTADGAWLSRWLRDHAPRPVPTLAAPGLSPHGRGSAIDFQVHRDGRVVAGPQSATVEAVWKRGGWDAKLAAAVTASGAPFIGPLQSPDEPWHYRYAPSEIAPREPPPCAG